MSTEESTPFPAMAVFRALLVAFAAGKGLWSLVAASPLLLEERGTSFPVGLSVAHVAFFGVTGLFLFLAGGRDSRARDLGATYALIASSFADGPLFDRASLEPLAHWRLGVLPLDAFLPYFAWAFADGFPRPPSHSKALLVARYCRIAAFFLSLSLFAGAIIHRTQEGYLLPGLSSEPLGENDLPHYWDLILGAILAAFVFAIWKSRRASSEERRRFELFLYGSFLGCLPLILVVLATSHVPGVSQFFRESRLLIGILVYPPFLAIPLLATYSLLVDNVLDLKLLVRRALQYALARHAVLAVALLPPAYFAALLYAHRRQPLDELLAGWRFTAVVAVFGLGLIALRWRRRLLEAIDRSFFREQLNSKDTLGALVRRSREVGSVRELAALLETEIDRALHLESVALLCRTEGGLFLAPTSTARPLSAGSRLAFLISAAVGPLEFDWSRSSTHRDLPEDDAHWLVDGGFRLLMPLTSTEGELLGVLCLGEKRSELPFSTEDLALLQAAADSAATTIENYRLRSTPFDFETGPESPKSSPLEASTPHRPARLDATFPRVPAAATRLEQVIAYECSTCGTIVARTLKWCEECAAPTVPARVPQILAGKFQFEARIGKGGMGVVYRARDLTLGRSVAIKTLPRVASRYAARLRREARAMAAVTHPNLALIHGAESWYGQPMLIFEYLSGGTLAARLEAEGTLPLHEVVDLGVVLADVLSCIHDAGILHRDIKPSNVGYTLADTPKLLDFGFARLLGDSWRESAAAPPSVFGDGKDNGEDAGDLTATGEIVGTPLYLSPEAVRGDPAQPSFDLWSLSILLYEAWTGANPLRGVTLEETLANVACGTVPDVRVFRPETPEELARFFSGALDSSRRKRPRTASQLRERLESFRGRALT